MKKLFLSLVTVSLAFSFETSAETKYYPSDPDDIYGILTGISPNGQCAVVSDLDDNVSYFWHLDNPEEYEFVTDEALLYAASDNGIAVGALALLDQYQYRAAIYNYHTNEWKQLPDHPALLNEQYANCITSDGKVIAGYEMDYSADSELGGRYYPVVWTLNEETGEYDITLFNDLPLPQHQGFVTKCMSPDGKYLGGRLYCAFASEIPAMIDIEKHEIIFWNELETRIEPFEYKGEILGYFEEQYVDGYHDTSSINTFSGEFMSCDQFGNFYGHRTVVYNVSEDGQEGDLVHYASIYNYLTGEWTDVEGVSAFSIGYNDAETMFATGAKMVVMTDNGQPEIESIYDGLGFTSSDDISGITNGSVDGKVLGGIYAIIHPATGEPQYHPFMIVLDNPLSGISEITIDHRSDVMILVAKGQIEVANAKSVAVYDLKGRLVSASPSSSVKAGVYIVKADDLTKKVIVK